MTKTLFAEHVLGKNHTWAPFVVPSPYPMCFVVMTNAQTSTWGQIAEVLFLSVHSSSYWIILWSKGYRDRKGRKIVTRLREHSRQITEDNCREEMHPESLEREVLKHHHDMWFLL